MTKKNWTLVPNQTDAGERRGSVEGIHIYDVGDYGIVVNDTRKVLGLWEITQAGTAATSPGAIRYALEE